MFFKISCFILSTLLFLQYGFCQKNYLAETKTNKNSYRTNPLQQKFDCKKQPGKDAVYSITLCVDIPVNTNPKKLNVGRETGHVFIILSIIDSVNKDLYADIVYGFYPLRPAKSLIFRKVRSVIFDNGGRKYDIAVKKKIFLKMNSIN